MSKKYQNIVDKNKAKAKRRVKIPTTVKDHVTNLSIDMKSLQSNLERMDRCRWLIYQSFDSLKQLIRLLQRQNLLGSLEDWKSEMCETCPFKDGLLKEVTEIYAASTLNEEGKMEIEVEIWNGFIDKIKKGEL